MTRPPNPFAEKARTIEQMLVELLAIKLYEQDTIPSSLIEEKGSSRESLMATQFKTCWAAIGEEDRELYRDCARGTEAYGTEDSFG